MKIVYTTVPRLSDAEKLATQLVEEGLVACVNIIPGIMAVYQWEGKIQKPTECILLCKTSAEAAHRLMDRVAEIHPYDTPALFTLAPEDVEKAYSGWITDSVANAH